MNRLLSLAILALTALTAAAAEPVDSLKPTIADHINTGATVKITQPAKLNDRLRSTAPRNSAGADANTPANAADQPRTDGGFRILVFSGNNPRTAKAEATRRQQILAQQFPEYATYVTFDAPYWRLKAGDFRKYEDAAAALSRFKAAMPGHAGEMRVVRERINL
ncbi:MAG: SPOR domain-containing protein [Muribaculaceae bacterium]|nr:SPOR domain-containing protein [Muribaculaceae bacterium]MDE7335364.1 SPOR domain-containing protein [Muribaculaceae bacterium]